MMKEKNFKMIISGPVVAQRKRLGGKSVLLCLSKNADFRVGTVVVPSDMWDLQEHEARWPEHVTMAVRWEAAKKRFVATEILECKEMEFQL